MEFDAGLEPAVHYFAGDAEPGSGTADRRRDWRRPSRAFPPTPIIDQSIYVEAGVYRSALQGASVANNGNLNNNIISGVAPYWRIAYENDWGNNSWEFGTFGLEAQLENPTTPAGNAINISLQNAPTDRFIDVGLDSQYQYIDDATQITVTGRWTHENQNLGASFGAGNADNTTNNLNFLSLVGSYYWHRKLGASLGFFNVSGSTDAHLFRQRHRQARQHLRQRRDRLRALAQRQAGPAVHGLLQVQRRDIEL